MRLARPFGILLTIALIAGCSAAASGQRVALPTSPTAPPGQAVLCATALFTPFAVVGDPTKSPPVWGVNSFGDVFPIIWPPGFTARFSPSLEILDPSGAVVARAGVPITDAGGGSIVGGDGDLLCSIGGKT